MANKYNRAALAILEVLGDRVDYVQYRENRNAHRNSEAVGQSGSSLDLFLRSDKHLAKAHEYIDLSDGDDAEEFSSDEILDLSVKAVEQFLDEDDCRQCGRAYSEGQKEEILAEAKARLTAALAGEEVRHD